MTLKDKYNKLLEAMELLGSYNYCDCGCPNNASGRIAGTPAQIWSIANTALKNVGHKIKVYNEDSSN